MTTREPTLIGTGRRVVTSPARALEADPGDPPGGLRIVRAGRTMADIELRDDERYVVGRHDAADVSFDDPAVSRLHGVLRQQLGRWLFEDHDSGNGSMLWRAGQPAPLPITARSAVAIAVGDAIELGTDRARIEFVARPTPRRGDLGAVSLSDAAREFDRMLSLAAHTRAPVFLYGPPGCGKTHAARQIHLRGRNDGPFVPINCARLPQDASALHSELLGHVRGAFTGAESDRVGKLIHAAGGTLFLDEADSLPELGQGFLLDVLEGTGDLAPLGGRTPLLQAPVFRLISASKRPLGQSALRDDLCERLASGHLWQVPTLEQRRADIPGLLQLFAREQSTLLGVEINLPDDAIALARVAEWPGQVRQLKATIAVLAQIAVARLPLDQPLPRRLTVTRRALEAQLDERVRGFGQHPPAVAAASVAEVEPVSHKADPRRLTRAQLAATLAEVSGNQSAAARRLGIARNTLARRAREFGLT